MSLSKADTPKVSTPKLGPKMAADIQMTPRLEKTLKQFKQYKGAVQFVEEYTCRYCGSTRMDPLRKGLDSKARRQLATLAVTEINKHMPPQYNIRLRVTDKGLAGINAKKRKGIFFDKADDIQVCICRVDRTFAPSCRYVHLEHSIYVVELSSHLRAWISA